MELGSLFFAVYGDIQGALGIAKSLGIEPEDKLHTGIGGCRHEANVLKNLLGKLGEK